MPVLLPFLSKVTIEVDVGETLPYYLNNIRNKTQADLITLSSSLKKD